MLRQPSSTAYSRVAIFFVLTFAGLSAYAQFSTPPSFSSIDEANAYVRSIAPKDATCSDNKNKLAGCYVTRGPAKLWIDEKYDAEARVLGIQLAVINTSFPGEDDYRQATATFDMFVETSITPFLSSLQLDGETIKQCTTKSTEAKVSRVLTLGERTYRFSCSYTSSKDAGQFFSYALLLTDPK
jgi:hypothetical protein